MGRKVHPIGFRLNVNQDWRGRWFAEGAQYREQLNQDFAIRDCIRQEAGRAGVSRIDVERFPGQAEGGCLYRQARHPDRPQGRRHQEDPHLLWKT